MRHSLGFFPFFIVIFSGAVFCVSAFLKFPQGASEHFKMLTSNAMVLGGAFGAVLGAAVGAFGSMKAFGMMSKDHSAKYHEYWNAVDRFRREQENSPTPFAKPPQLPGNLRSQYLRARFVVVAAAFAGAAIGGYGTGAATRCAATALFLDAPTSSAVTPAP